MPVSWKASPPIQFKIVGSVTGDWDQTTARRWSRRSCRRCRIVGIVDQGGDGYGAAAGSPPPASAPDHHHGNRRQLQWWRTEGKDGYQTWSASIAPGVSSLASGLRSRCSTATDIPRSFGLISPLRDDFEAELPKSSRAASPVTNTQEDAIAAIKPTSK
jgi:ribose transport system substrate-binding protein